MSTMILTFILDVLLATLLTITIVFCWKLSRRIRVLQDSKSELSQLISQFDASTERATASILEIQGASKRITENIQAKLEKANYLADDLAFMIERGSKLADHMASGISSSRNKTSVRGGEVLAPGATSKPSPMPRPAESKTAASLESVLEHMNTRHGGPADEAKPSQLAPNRQAPNARLRSKAEQELYEALKSGRG